MKTKFKVGFAVFGAFMAWLLLQILYVENTIPSPEEFVRSYGYPLESHEVVTKDGYILTLFRIPHGKGQEISSRHPVLIHHGLMGSSYNFLGFGPKLSLGFLLADEGYDVWLANCRGVKYSLKHVSYNSSNSEYWNYSWHEIGVYDLPAVIDYILKTTNKEKLSYIGHSMGGTVLAVLLTSKPEYNNKLDVFLGLAPALLFEKIEPVLLNFLFRYYAPFMINTIGHGNWCPWTEEIKKFLVMFCSSGKLMANLCFTLYHDQGYSTQMYEEKIPVVISTSATTISLKTMAHYGHLADYGKGKFIHYNYGPDENKRRYGTEDPPEYDLKKMTVPTVLFYSDGDMSVPSKGILKFSQIVPNASTYKIPLETFNHVDFVYGKDVDDLLYKKMINVLNGRTSNG